MKKNRLLIVATIAAVLVAVVVIYRASFVDQNTPPEVVRSTKYLQTIDKNKFPLLYDFEFGSIGLESEINMENFGYSFVLAYEGEKPENVKVIKQMYASSLFFNNWRVQTRLNNHSRKSYGVQ